MYHSIRRAGSLLLLLSMAVPGAALVALLPAASPAQQTAAAKGTIRGRVTEQGGQAVDAAQVVIVGQRIGAITDNNGDYVIHGAPAGTVTLRATRIGLQPGSQTVTVTAGGETTANFTLSRAVAQLEEVVTTATGQESRQEFGNAVSMVKTDSIVQTAPVSNVNEVLEGRASGVQIISGTGQVGASSAIRIRGTSSLSLTNDPLIIVDGIRYDNSPQNGSGLGGTFTTQPENRLGELNPDEIESMEVIKGPSAAALYGTAAANGVIVITTKQGTAGKARWQAWAEQGSDAMPSRFEDNWTSWGHNLNTAGQEIGKAIQCHLAQKSLGLCQVDSLTANDPYTNPLTDPFYKSTPRSQLGLSVSGGSDLLRYFISGDRIGETGPYTMPTSEINRLTTLHGYAPSNVEINPNQDQENTLRGNFQVALAPNATINISTGFLDRMLQTPFDGGYFAGLTFQMMTAPGCAVNCALTATNGTQREYVGDIFSVQQQETSQRFTGSAALNWAPQDWLQVRSTIGIDNSNDYQYRLQLLGEGPYHGAAWGPSSAQGFSGIQDDRFTSDKYSVDLGATATRSLTSSLTSKTTVGAQWFRDELYDTQGLGFGFAPGVSTPNSASQQNSYEFTTENATYGAFVEEELGYQDKLYGTVSVRTDQNSAFGRNVGNTVYPRASLSYVLSNEKWFPKVFGLSSFRYRAAIGEAGVQPGTLAALQYLSATTFPLAGNEQPGLVLASIGNANLKPEVTTEFETGFDAGFLRDRINVTATFYNKESHDALYNLPLPPSYGTTLGTEYVNLAQVENRGEELDIAGSILRGGFFSWDLSVNGSHNVNKLISAGNVQLPTAPGARNVVGYPLFGLWDRPILGYSDKNHDGIITENEVTVGAQQAFRGSTLPLYEAGVNNTFGFFHDRLHVSGLIDYRGDFWNQWGYQNQRCVSTGNCPWVNVPGTPLADQAAAVMGASATNRTIWGFYVPNDYMRLRELSVSYNLPHQLTRHFLGSHDASLVLSGRNLGVLWTKFPGLDPETNVSVAATGGGDNAFYSEPLLRYYIARLNVAF